MKKLLLSTFGLMTGLGAFAQLPVSQTAENKHAILEEFTGLYCTFCPDGHAVGATIANANPNTYHRIHIHAGGFATPGPNDPDMRTPSGTTLDNSANSVGYPAGGTNRGTSASWAVGRGSWNSAATSVLGQSSYVNVALEGTVVEATRELTVNVEVFYTGTAPTNDQYLTVALLQNNILGHQTDGGNFFPIGWKCQPQDVYKHNHVLRMLLNTGGTNGEAVSTTTGAVVSKQYVMTLPAQIAGVDLEVGELELVAFVTEGNNITSPIVSGNDGSVTVTLGSGITSADLSSTSSHTAPTGGLCDNVFTPKMDVTNNSGTSVTGLDLSYIVNGSATTVNLPTQTIAAGATYSHTFAVTNLAGGSNTIEYDATISDPTKNDLESWNNNSCSDLITVISSTAFGTSVSEGFEGIAVGAVDINNTVFVNPNGGLDYVVDNGISSAVTWPLGGFGYSAKSMRWRNYNNAVGVTSSIIYEKVDLSTTTGNMITFSHAYAQYQTENDRLEVFASTDCGVTWTSLWMKQGAGLSTAPATTNAFYPQISEWASNNISLSSYESETELMIKFEGTSAFGNNVYIDDINLSIFTSVEENSFVKNSLSVYPNPSNSFATVSFDLAQTSSVSMEVYNAMGSLVQNIPAETMSAGNHQLTFNGTELSNGIYFVNLTVGDQIISKKVSLLK